MTNPITCKHEKTMTDHEAEALARQLMPSYVRVAISSDMDMGFARGMGFEWPDTGKRHAIMARSSKWTPDLIEMMVSRLAPIVNHTLCAHEKTIKTGSRYYCPACQRTLERNPNREKVK